MNRNTVNTAIKLIGYALKNETVDPSFSDGFSEDEFKRIIKFAHAHRMLPMVADVLIKSGALESGSQLAAFLRKKQFEDVLKSQKRDYELQRIGELFETLQIKYIPLKGSVIKTLYPEPWMRTSCDIDILISPDDIPIAVEALTERLGFKRHSETFHDVSFDTESKVHIELHHTLIEEDFKSGVKETLDKVWDYATPKADGCEMLLRPDMFLFYHIAHMAKHITIGGCGIRPFADLYLLRQCMDLEDESFLAMLKDTELVTFFEAAVALCDVWFSGAQHTELTEELEKYVLEGGVFGSTQNGLAVSRGDGESNKEHFAKLIFLPKKQLELVYPALKKRPWLFPFYQVRRWFRVFDRKKRSKFVQSMNIGSELGEEHINKVSLLMKELELK